LALGRRAGLTDAQATLLGGEDWVDSELFTPADKAVIRWTTHIAHNTAGTADDVFTELSTHFGPPEIVEITLAAALFNMLNRVKDALQIGTEPATTLAGITGSLDVNLPALRDHLSALVTEIDDLMEKGLK